MMHGDGGDVRVFLSVVEVFSSWTARERDVLVQIYRKLRHQPAHAQRLSLLPLQEVLAVGHVQNGYDSQCSPVSLPAPAVWIAGIAMAPSVCLSVRLSFRVIDNS